MAESGPRSMQLPSAREAERWAGYRLDELGGAAVGRVHGIFVDAVDGEPVWTIARLGRFGKLIAIPLVDCAAGAGRVWAAHERGRLRGAPAIDGEKPLTREQELAICEHYGIHEGYGRAGQVSAREDGAITSHRTAGGA